MPRLRVLAGTTPSSLVPISDIVNTDKPHTISSDFFAGQVVVNVKGFTDPRGRVLDSEYFHRPDRKDITWSIQVQGRFLHHHTADDILFGNTFDRPLKLPWGSGAALKFMNYVDPTLEHDLTSHTKPWALSPLISTMPHFSHKRLHGSRSSSRSSSHSRHSRNPSSEFNFREEPAQGHGHQHHLSVSNADKFQLPPFPPERSMEDDLSHIHLVHLKNSDGSTSSSGSEFSLSSASSSSSLSLGEDAKNSTKTKLKQTAAKAMPKMKAKLGSAGPHSLNLHTAQQRHAYFHKAKHRKEVIFGPHDILTMDFCYGFLEFNPTLALRLPGGVSFDLMRYWDGQPVRFVCCERKSESENKTYVPDSEDPWGRMFWCVQIELAESESESEATEGDIADEEFHDMEDEHVFDDID